jgi:hypothetical protein
VPEPTIPLFTSSLTSTLRFSLPPRTSLVGGCGVGLAHCARRDNATNWNAGLLKQIGNHCLSAFLAQHLIAGSSTHRGGKASHPDHVALWVDRRTDSYAEDAWLT